MEKKYTFNYDNVTMFSSVKIKNARVTSFIPFEET